MSNSGESSTYRSFSSFSFDLVDGSDESRNTLQPSFGDDEEVNVVTASESVPLVEELMKRILKTSSFLKSCKEYVDGQLENENREETLLNEELQRLSGWLDLYQLLWGRLLFILYAEHEKSSDVYSDTLDLQDRVPFESLAHAIHHNTEFCDILGEITSFSIEQQIDSDVARDDFFSSVFREYWQKMEQIQLTAIYSAVLVVEGSRENFLDPVPMADLCQAVTKENARKNRLVSLSLMFSMLDQDELALNEALSQDVPRILLQRFRHLVHRLFGPFPERKGGDTSQHHPTRSPNGHTNGVALQSEMDMIISQGPSSLQQPLPGTNLEHTEAKNLQSSGMNARKEALDSPLPTSPCLEGTFQVAEAVLFSKTPCAKRDREQESFFTSKRARLSQSDGFTLSQAFFWEPQLGDKVSRGPGWRHGKQGKHCDYGEVVGVTKDNEVVVKWIPSADFGRERSEGRMFRYKFGSPFFEVMLWEDYIRAKTMTVNHDAFRMLEFMLTCAVVGILCQQQDTILPALQFQTIESTLHVFRSVKLCILNELFENATVCATKAIEEVFDNPAVSAVTDKKNKIDEILSWDVTLYEAKQKYRESRELIARIGWVLNALLSHKKLALLFLNRGGLSQLTDIIKRPLSMATRYGCGIVLAHLARASVFEELLRNYSAFFQPIMIFIIEQWRDSSSTDVQEGAGAFLFNCLSFPCALKFFDDFGGGELLLGTLERNLKLSEERFDVLFPGLQLAALKCINVYLITHLMLATKVVFRKHRVLSTLITKATPQNSLPREPTIVDSVLFFLSCSTSTLPDVSIENVLSLLLTERLPFLTKILDGGIHNILLRGIGFYFLQSRWELLIASLHALCVLTVVPHVRPLVTEPHANESGIGQLLSIANDLSVSYQNGNHSREHHLLPNVVVVLQILIHLLMPPIDGVDEAAATVFGNVCSAFRANDGVRTLLEILKIRKDSSLSAKLNFFPVVARAVQLMAVLRRYGDTKLLFEALGVHRVAQDLLQEYSNAQREYMAMMGSWKLHGAELDPAGRFMENVKSLMPTAFSEPDHSDVVKAHPADALEIEQRNAIISRAVVDYSQESLLSLISHHLEARGLTRSAEALRLESNLPTSMSSSLDSKGAMNDQTLDGIIRTYLRQQQEKCPNPIETLPQFDLTKKHVYVPSPPPPDHSRNIFNRLLERKTGIGHSLRTHVNSDCLTYRCPAFMFDISGGDEGIRGESICFCDRGDALMIGTSEGAVALFDTFPGEESNEKLLDQHIVFENEGVASLVVSDNGLLVAAVSEGYNAKVMSRQSLPVARYELSGCRALRFSNNNKLLLATSEDEHACRLYDLNTQQEICTFSDHNWAGENMDNVAVFDCTSTLVLHDAILWDVRCSNKPIYRFDRITESFASTFHPSNQMVLIDEKVWDLRSFHMMQTVPAFQKTSSFHINQLGRVIYSFRQSSALTHTTTPIVSAVNAYSFEVIFSEETSPPFKSFALDPSDRFCAAILDENFQAVIRIFLTSSGPYPNRTGFALPQPQQQSPEGGFEEDEAGDWSSNDDDYELYDDESSVTYSGEDEREGTVVNSHSSTLTSSAVSNSDEATVEEMTSATASEDESMVRST